MFVRSALLLVALLLLVAAVSDVVAPHELRSGRGAAALGAIAANPVPPRTPADVRTMTFELPASKPYVVTVGDIVTVAASSPSADVLDVPALGVSTPIGPGLPASLQIVTDHPGRFSIVLRYSGRRLGILDVRPAA